MASFYKPSNSVAGCLFAQLTTYTDSKAMVAFSERNQNTIYIASLQHVILAYTSLHTQLPSTLPAAEVAN